jgi:hypothetical protein
VAVGDTDVVVRVAFVLPGFDVATSDTRATHNFIPVELDTLFGRVEFPDVFPFVLVGVIPGSSPPFVHNPSGAITIFDAVAGIEDDYKQLLHFSEFLV